MAGVGVDLSPEMQHLFLNKKDQRPHGLNLRKAILLDCQSTVDLFCDSTMVTDIQASPNTMTVRSTGGKLIVNQTAKVPGYNTAIGAPPIRIANRGS